AAAARQVQLLARVDQVGVADLRIGVDQRRQRNAVAGGDAGHGVAAAHAVATAAVARQVDRLAGVDQVGIADLRVGRDQGIERHVVGGSDAGQGVTGAHRVTAAGARAAAGVAAIARIGRLVGNGRAALVDVAVHAPADRVGSLARGDAAVAVAVQATVPLIGAAAAGPQRRRRIGLGRTIEHRRVHALERGQVAVLRAGALHEVLLDV